MSARVYGRARKHGRMGVRDHCASRDLTAQSEVDNLLVIRLRPMAPFGLANAVPGKSAMPWLKSRPYPSRIFAGGSGAPARNDHKYAPRGQCIELTS
jgi:hypothetical protein